MARLKVDKFPKNGKTTPNPSLPNITAAKKPSIKEGPGENMPEMGARSRPGGQYSAGGKSGTPAADTAAGTNAAHSKGTVPIGGHHQASHRAPTSHAEFGKLGSGHWKP